MKKPAKAGTAKPKRAGVMPTSMVFTEEQKAKLDAFAAELGVGRVPAIMEAINSYTTQGGVRGASSAELLAEIERRLR